MIRALLALAAIAFIAAPAPARERDQQAKLREITERGRLLFEVDRAAWVTTDDMLKRAPEARGWPAKGWVVERDGDAPHAFTVTYYGDSEGGPRAWYAGKVRDGKIVSGEIFPAEARPLLSEAQVRIARAKEAAAKLRYSPCTPSQFNVAAIPPDAPDGPVEVYLLSAQTDANVFPFGGHYLVRVGPDGQIQSERKFTNSCLNISTADAPEGGGALFVTHLVDPLPTEIHVFMSLSMGIPVGVGTRKRLWLVAGGEIALLDSR